ncbi:polyhydroxyalkanoate synthesis repressor PhaR [Elioraea tepida]|uniref:Polyhydroxyalkanoate synthesis repressor PhaR n=1 Tax=Elioraea tepida TaxID=2843330 RepID=A0A975YIS7_9PROT|nr:polyhydroxyalkanoate synthesis repressor PhaR [Elioraea tepida]QXM23722.1 polyhydroxyalkanoate synthesis repressor PhaR [Elioraea tepida]
MAEPAPAAEAVTKEPGAQAADTPSPVVVKKYANRRLYNTEASSYVTLDHLAQMVKDGREFVVYDAKTGEDITRQVLTQIIVEEEAKGSNLLPISFLRQLISFYGDSLQGLVPRYLEHAMAAFARQQEQFRRAMQQTMEGFFPFSMEEVGKQNMAMLERAFSLFAPFYRPPSAQGAEPPAQAQDEAAQLAKLKAELEALREELARLTKPKV